MNQIPGTHCDPYELLDEVDWPSGLLYDEAKVRIFICACCRLIWDKLPDVARGALEVAEEYVDGRSSAGTLVSERVKLWEYLGKESCNFSSPVVNAVRAVICCLYEDIPNVEMYDYVRNTLEFCNDVEDNCQAQCRLMREVFGDPSAA